MSVLFLLLLIIFVDDTVCLRNVRLILPDSVAEGGVATLFCLYELQREPLYSVKWYRGNHEIFRYLPRENPRIRIFSLPGLYIDINSSNSHRLTLLDVPKHLGGNYSCEVSADEPAYTTALVTGYLEVTPKEDSEYKEKTISENYAKLNNTNPYSYTNKNVGLRNVEANISLLLLLVLFLIIMNLLSKIT